MLNIFMRRVVTVGLEYEAVTGTYLFIYNSKIVEVKSKFYDIRNTFFQ